MCSEFSSGASSAGCSEATAAAWLGWKLPGLEEKAESIRWLSWAWRRREARREELTVPAVPG